MLLGYAIKKNKIDKRSKFALIIFSAKVLLCSVGYLRDKEGLIAFGKRMREIRKEKGFSQEELAYATGLALSQIGRMERGQLNIGLSTVFVICRVLDVPLSYLFDFTLPVLDVSQFTK